MIEYNIIKLFIDNKDIYNKYNKYIDYKYIKDNYKILYKIILTIDNIYNKYNNIYINKEELESNYISLYPIISSIDRQELSLVLDNIYTTSSSPEIIIDYLESHKRRCLAGQIAQKALEYMDGKIPLGPLKTLFSELEEVKLGVDTNIVSQCLGALLQGPNVGPGIRWRMNWLNRCLGPLRKGDFGVVFGRPEVGKTSFLASEATHFISQNISKENPVVWFNNEEQGWKVMVRCYQAYFGITFMELQNNITIYEDRFIKEVGNKLILVDETPMDFKGIERRCRELNPGLVVIDQLDKIKGFKADRKDLELGECYEWARKLAKQYAPVIGTCQADGTAENVEYLTMGHMANAKTEKQEELDFILGIGSVFVPALQKVRYLNICKNKLVGDSNTDPKLRHGRTQVVINSEIARYEEV